MNDKPIKHVGRHEPDALSLLATSRTPNNQLVYLPEPPFMVPAVVEDLRTCPLDTSFTDVVHLVAGEADKYCAAHGLRTGATVLSNDSDLMVFDTGEEGSVLILDSLEAKTSEDADGIEISGSILRPNQIITTLRVDSLLRVAFERFKDPYISFNNVVRRAQLPLKPQDQSTFSTFMKEYAVGDANLVSAFPSPSIKLDTRISELYHQLCRPQERSSQEYPQIYLPMLIENHARTNSWTFGLPLRILAYSLLNLSSHSDATIVEEHTRSGSRIRPRQLALHTNATSPALSSIVATTLHNLRTMRALLSPTIQDAKPLLWRLIATCYLLQSLQRNQRPFPDEEWLIGFLRDGYVEGCLALDAVHFDANLQAVWYSFRMLRQVVCLIQQGSRGLEAGGGCRLRELEVEMDDMPGLCDGLVSRIEVAGSSSPEGRRAVGSAVGVLYKRFGAE